MSHAQTFASAVRTIAVPQGWTAYQGTVTSVRDGIGYHSYAFAAGAYLMVKPLAWDLALWRLFNMPPRRSPSFHFRSGACPAPLIHSELDMPDNARNRAEALCAFASRAFAQPPPNFSFPGYAQSDVTGRPESDFVITEAAARLAAGDSDAAVRIADDAVSGRRPVTRTLSLWTGRASVDVFSRILETSADAPN